MTFIHFDGTINFSENLQGETHKEHMRNPRKS